MLIIGHRGAKGLSPENTLESLQAGIDAGADMLEFDVRLTADKIPVLVHGGKLNERRVSRTTLAGLQKSGAVTTLEAILDEFFGKILLNLEYKPVSGVEAVYKLIAKKYIREDHDWDNILFSSFHLRPLIRLRKLNRHANLSLLHSISPFAFVAYHRYLNLAAVGWHRLHVNKLGVEIAKKAGIFSYVYTVNRPQAAKILEQKGVDGIVTDYPDRMVRNNK